jgi:hypothetical protein
MSRDVNIIYPQGLFVLKENERNTKSERENENFLLFHWTENERKMRSENMWGRKFSLKAHN